ncbi:MAG: hypothetical protein R2731_18110 [Nocardioides sp.]
MRAEKGAGQVVVVDNGDFLQGTPVDYYFAVQEPVTQTGLDHPMAVAYNAIGYDARSWATTSSTTASPCSTPTSRTPTSRSSAPA